VNHAVIERSVAYNNGAQNTHDGGPVGIWAYGSNDVLIQHNESHHNRTNSAVDGGGFDLDGGTTNSIMQYNYSHDNDGHGYLLAQYPGAAAFSGNIVRYNISQNDGRKNGAGGISIWNGNGSNGIGMSKIYNNTVYMDKLNATTPSAVLIIGDQAIDAKFSNNIFITKNGARHNTLYATSPSNIGVKFENNNYYAVDGSTQFTWGASAYSSLATWRTGTGQETVSAVATGFNLDPKLMNAGLGATLNDANELERMNAYELTSSSPMIGKAYSSAKLGATPVSLQDFNGDALPQGTSYDMGADEFITTTTEVDTIAPVSPTNVTGLGVTDTRIDLSWNASSDNIGVVGYSIYRAGILVGSSPTTSYTDEGLAAASAYSYSVVAYDAAGNVSAKSTSVSISTLATDAPVPDFSFGVGAGIQTIADTVVMSKPGAGKKRGVQFARAVGTISSGPKTLSGTVWWQVDFTTSVDGWVMEDTLELTAIAFEALPQKNFFLAGSERQWNHV
jgi:chitodextrinase